MKPAKRISAFDRLEAIRSAIDARFPDAEDKEKRARARAACDFGDELRVRRNEASHALGSHFGDRDEVEELLRACGRNLPKLWEMVT